MKQFTKFLEEASNTWESFSRKQKIVICSISCLCVVFVILFIVVCLKLLINHFEQLLAVVILAAFAVIYQKSNTPNEDKSKDTTRNENQLLLQYKTLAKILQEVLVNVGDALDLKTPKIIAELFVTDKFSCFSGFPVHTFQVKKDLKCFLGTEVIRFTLNHEIYRMLKDRDIKIKNTFYNFEGNLLPSIWVSEVYDKGDYFYVDIIFVNNISAKRYFDDIESMVGRYDEF